jgi:hypothetical protein
MRTLAPLLALSACLLGLNGSSAGADPQAPFSRSRWIEAQKAWGARFPENLVPENPRRLREFLAKLASAAPPRGGIPKGVVRVSADLLSPTPSTPQPGTETEPFLAADPENPLHLLAGYQEDRFLEDGCRALTAAVSFDGGRTWRESLIPKVAAATGGPYERTSDPWVAFGPGGRAYFVSLGFDETSPPNGVFVSASDDGGVTWGDPVTVHSGTQSFDDKEAIVVDTRDDSPYKGRVYVIWDSVSGDQQAQVVMISFSDDGGRSFQTPFVVSDQGANVGALPLVGPGGILHAVWLSYHGAFPTLLTSHSTDGGRSWGAPVPISDVRAAGVAGSRTGSGIPSAAIDARTGALYVVWQDNRFTPGTDQIAFSRSTDGGESWTAPRRISDGPTSAANFTPAVAVSAAGWVGVSYYSLRNDRSGVKVDEYLTLSSNRGQKFGRSARASIASWDLRYVATSDGFFLGDYQGLAASGKTFYPLWIATFAPVPGEPAARQPDVFTRAINTR